MTLNLSFEDLKRIALDGRVVKNGITLIVGRPLIPDVKTDASGKLGEVRFTVDNTQVRPHGLRLVKLGSSESAVGPG
jgi:hypothetical protein